MIKEHLITHIKLDKGIHATDDISVEWVGAEEPRFIEVDGRSGLIFDGSSYLILDDDLLKEVNDDTGFTFSSWVYLDKGSSMWERIFDFGSGEGKPSLYMTRNLRATLAGYGDLVTDASKRYEEKEWMHVAFVYSPTERARNSSAGGCLYINGECLDNGMINQTTSGLFTQLRQWANSLDDENFYHKNYLGHSQYTVDPNFKGMLSDVMIFNKNLTESEVFGIMSTSFSDEEIIKIAKTRDLDLGEHIIYTDLQLPKNLFGGLVDVTYSSSNPKVLSDTGKIGSLNKPEHVVLKAILERNNIMESKTFDFTVLPKDVAASEIVVRNEVQAEVSEILYGLFYEDINNAADGGIYAEMVRNRSFESFIFDGYEPTDNVCGCETGRNLDPYQGWYGELDKTEIRTENSLNDFLKLRENTNEHYIHIEDATIINKGYNDTMDYCAMNFKENHKYDFTLWMRGKAELTVYFKSSQGEIISEKHHIEVNTNNWMSLDRQEIESLATGLGELHIEVEGVVDLDMISLMPQTVWGNHQDDITNSSASNYQINSNYRLRIDLVEALYDLNPKFLRFPGGCISEGSYLWNNVFDWKHTIGSIEERTENYNVWGYSMTMGLGYFEYFQLAEDLDAYPVPVMACGVLCQARSDYAAAAGGTLRDYYITNFTDLIDFAISEDFEGNKWAQKRKELGHPEPFDLQYLGVGNENWGDEFYANFEIFKTAIDQHMEENYPGRKMYIISTVGAQADDDAFQDGWKFIHGDHNGKDELEFTDGEKVFKEKIDWYKNYDNYMDTIVDEHYYRSNEYLLNNVDRYDYYERVYDETGQLNEQQTSKVFVGEYASTDKNTLRGAVHEAALMTGFENNSDVVRMASYAPLFNKVLNDGMYRWTPDLIWFDNEDVWYTPNYYTQKLFANNLGDKVLKTDFKTFNNAEEIILQPQGGISVMSEESAWLIKELKVLDDDENTIFEQDFSETLSDEITLINEANISFRENGIIINSLEEASSGLWINRSFKNYRLEIDCLRIEGNNSLHIGVGVTSLFPKNSLEYVLNYQKNVTGLKVFKDGIEGYKMGDFTSSHVAGNLRRSLDETITNDEDIKVIVNYQDDAYSAYYLDNNKVKGKITTKNRAYSKEVFHTVSEDKNYLYIKIVNVSNLETLTSINLRHFDIQEITMTTLTGNDDLLDTPNVNDKQNERIKPTLTNIDLKDGMVSVPLEGNSVNIIKAVKNIFE